MKEMKNRIIFRLFTSVFFIGNICNVSLKAQDIKINESLLNSQWSASWITCPNSFSKEYGVYHFRKQFTLDSIPQSFIIHVSADNRYRLFVNGVFVSNGPARGDLAHWYFESLDIAPYLKTSENIIAALVWNMGKYAPVAQISNQTAFVLQGDGKAEQTVNTNGSWKVIQSKAYRPCSTNNEQRVRNYMVVGPGDQVNGSLYPWNWETLNYNDSDWQKAEVIAKAVPFGCGTDNLWTLVPRNIPLFAEKEQRLNVVRRCESIKLPDNHFTAKRALIIPANSDVSILLDQTYNTVGYPEIITSKGKGSIVKLTYAQALYDKNFVKGNRNEIEGKHIIGNDDIFEPDGGDNRKFRTLWLRTFRYLQLDITTKEQDLVIEDLYSLNTGYPFELAAKFSSDDESLQKIWDVAWRTSLICAGETFFDTPYYEQLQYPGDTRLQALITLYMAGDDRLMRKAILDFYYSKTPEGMVQGRYPSSRLQIIPPFALFWVSMVYDYWMHRDDNRFTEQFLSSIKDVLDWHERYLDKNTGILKDDMPWWNFIDWVPGLSNSRGSSKGNTAIRTLHYAYTLQQAVEMFKYFGRSEDAVHYEQIADKVNEQAYKLCFDPARRLFADSPEKKTYSQHANIMGVLSGAVPENSIKDVVQKTLSDTTLLQTTFYYKFYLTRALVKADMADRYCSLLAPWRQMLQLGLTTFAETPEPTRSDSHAWSSTPNYEFLATICGIRPNEPNFKSVLVKPAFGVLNEISGEFPHQLGKIKVNLKRSKDNKKVTGEIFLPKGLHGKFVWGEKIVLLSDEITKINMTK